jgi:maltose alpha-D-glucosyltransferase/alpha-amylase
MSGSKRRFSRSASDPDRNPAEQEDGMSAEDIRCWYKNAVFYGLDVATFQDSNGDGIGDFPGLCRRLDYLTALGVTCIWLLPFFPSPDRDNGYDVMDYFSVDPKLGTFDDFLTFVRSAGERGLRVMIDLVMDHTSDRHPWFQAARRDRRSRYRRYYVWTDAPPPTDPGKQNIFPDEESSVWTYDDVAGQYYFHQFYHFEPDLDVANPDVREEIKRVIDFWLSFGVSAFRVDAVSHMIDPHETIQAASSHDPHSMLRDLRSFTSARREDCALLGEADVEPEELRCFFGDGDEMHLLYNFLLNNYLSLAFATNQGEPLQRCLRLLPSPPENSQWVNFLRNLDELDLERLSDEERDAVYRAFAPDDNMRIFGRGIRRRLAPMLSDRRRLESAFSLLFSLPGTPLVIYGDELGMGEDLSLQGRNAVRTPMQWSRERQAGFSTASRDELPAPAISAGPFGFKAVNVADSEADPDSFLNWMKRLIRLRRQCPEWGWGSCHVVPTAEPGIFAHRAERNGRCLIAIHNLTEKPAVARLEREPDTGLVPIFSSRSKDAGQESSKLELEPYGYRWYRQERRIHA